MPLLADLFQVFILITCLIGLGLSSRRFFPEVPFSLHFCFAPVALVAVLFCLEHYLPLGQMPWLWIPGTALSLWLIRTAGGDLAKEPVLWYFILGFGFCFFWRYSYPDIYPFSDRLNDHVQLVSNAEGGRLPAEDVWMKGAKSNTYYIFQYYAAGLIHRFIGCTSGLTFHLGYCTIVGLTTAAIGSGIQQATKSIRAGLFASLCLILGGNGATLFVPFMDSRGAPSPLDAERFIGSYAMPAVPEFKTAFGVWLIHFIGLSQVDAPMEFYSYAIYLGDFHPPLSAFLFLALAILSIGCAERALPGSLTEKVCVAAAVATPFYVAISSTWTAPLQGILILGWLVYRWLMGRKDRWQFLLLSALVPLALIFPYFSQFAYETGGYGTHLQWVPQRPPFLNWLLIMLPAFLIWVGCLWAALTAPLARMIVVVGLVIMAGTFFIEMHSIYGGTFEIYDTAMKWWGWVFTSTLMLGLMCVWPHPVLRSIAVVFLALTILANSYILGEYWWYNPKDHMGRLDGYAWFTDDPHQNAIYQELQSLPKGVLLESAPDNAAAAISLAQFSGHYSLGGWTWFEMFWRGNPDDIFQLETNRNKFYNGTLNNPESWLQGIVPGGVTYIVWLQRDNQRGPKNWAKINDQIKDDYDWRETYQDGDDHWGIWMQRPNLNGSKN